MRQRTSLVVLTASVLALNLGAITSAQDVQYIRAVERAQEHRQS